MVLYPGQTPDPMILAVKALGLDPCHVKVTELSWEQAAPSLGGMIPTMVYNLKFVLTPDMEQYLNDVNRAAASVAGNIPKPLCKCPQPVQQPMLPPRGVTTYDPVPIIDEIPEEVFKNLKKGDGKTRIPKGRKV